MSKLSDARDLLSAIDACVLTHDAMDARLRAILKKYKAIDLEDDVANPDEEALQAFEEAVCYEVMIRKEKLGRNMTDDLVNTIKRIRRKKED